MLENRHKVSGWHLLQGTSPGTGKANAAALLRLGQTQGDL